MDICSCIYRVSASNQNYYETLRQGTTGYFLAGTYTDRNQLNIKRSNNTSATIFNTILPEPQSEIAPLPVRKISMPVSKPAKRLYSAALQAGHCTDARKTTLYQGCRTGIGGLDLRSVLQFGQVFLLHQKIFKCATRLLLQNQPYQYPDHRRHQGNRWKGHNKGKGPGLEPDGKNIADHSNIEHAYHKGHNAGHQQCHEKCENKILIFLIDHLQYLHQAEKRLHTAL